MKYSIALLAVGAGAAMAQSLNDLPTCGQTCVNNMINIASTQFGCAVGDITCYCTNVDFGYGVRDCANESCSAEDAAKVIGYGTNFCANAIQSASGVSSAPALSILSSALASATESGASVTGTGGAGGAQSTAISTVPLVATAVSDGQTILQTTGFSTLYSSLTGAAGSAASSVADSASSAAASITGSAASAASSIASSLNSEANSIASSGASRASSLAGAASSLASGATGATSTGAAPKMTGLPIAGAAGMAALFFL